MRDHQPTHAHARPSHEPSALDPRAPFVLDTRDLPRTPGAMRVVDRMVPAQADLGLELVRVPEGEPISLHVRLESVSEGVLVSARAHAAVRGECGRCLREIDDTLDVEFQQLYAYEHSTTEQTTDEDEVGRVHGDLIDLEPDVRDAVVLALPMNPTCRPECPGLCAGCGVPWDELPAGHSHDQTDPRWAALAQLRKS
ncbi:MAG TPA: YceD family protein [Micromonosporaceae bacterium]